MKSRRPILFLIAAAAGLAAFLGYRQGVPALDGPEISDLRAPVSERRERSDHRKPAPGVALQLLFKRPVNSRTTAESWAIIRAFSAGQIEEALREIASESDSEAVQLQTSMLHHRWAEIDPNAAMEAALGHANENSRETRVSSAFAAWMKQDADAAFQWAEASGKISSSKQRQMMAGMLANLPPEKALEKAGSYGPEVHKLTLNRLATNLSTTPDDRAAFLAELARGGSTAEDAQEAIRTLYAGWGGGDPAAALDAMAGEPFDDGKKQQTGKRIALQWGRKDPAAALAWLSAKPDAQPLETRVNIYKDWAVREPEDAMKQLGSLDPKAPGLREGVMKSMVDAYQQAGWNPRGSNAGMENADLNRLKSHYSHWAVEAPTQAATWLDHLDPALQEKITATDADERH